MDRAIVLVSIMLICLKFNRLLFLLSDSILFFLFSGLRFAEYQVKLGIATLISKYKLEVCDKTCSRYVLHPRTVIAMATEGLYAKFVEV